MVRSFPATRVDDTNVATYAGLEIAAFTLGQGIAAPIWARISDSIGRKPTLILANLLTIPGVLLFGCSTSLSMSIFTRFWAGLSNPNVGLVQTFVGEMASMEQQCIVSLGQLHDEPYLTFTHSNGVFLHWLLSHPGVSSSFLREVHTSDTLRNILGPPVGGYLSEPVLRYSFLFKENSVWDKFPYLLPNVFCALILFASVLFGLFFLEEVHPRLRHQPDISTRLLIWGRNLFHQEPFHVLDNHYSALNANDIDLEELSNVPNEESYKLAASESPPFNRRLAFTPQVRLQILSFAFFIYMRISLLAIEPVYFEYPYHTSPSSSYKLLHVIFGYPGGFGLSTTATSNILLTQAAATMLSQWFLVPQIIDRFGSLRSYKFVLGGFLGTYAVCPMVTGFPWWLGMIIIVPVMWFYSLINTLGTTAQSIM